MILERFPIREVDIYEVVATWGKYTRYPLYGGTIGGGHYMGVLELEGPPNGK